MTKNPSRKRGFHKRKGFILLEFKIQLLFVMEYDTGVQYANLLESILLRGYWCVFVEFQSI